MKKKKQKKTENRVTVEMNKSSLNFIIIALTAETWTRLMEDNSSWNS